MGHRCIRWHYLVVLLMLLMPILALGKNDSKCKNPVVRREWGTLTKRQRKDYIAAVLCMQRRSSELPYGLVEGAKNHHDDFAATHINQTSSIHFSGIFLAWHREFVFLWESALRNQCGYTGYQPYWDWPLMQSRGKIADSPLFDGSDTSLGGDGYPSNAYNCTVVGTFPNGTVNCMPRANGGGCMMSGPFVNSRANLGPFAFEQAFAGGPPQNWTRYNPRCLSRDFNDNEAQFLTYKWYNYNLAAGTIADLQDRLSGSGGTGGMHSEGHYVLGHAMWDFFASPYDPTFFLHHSGVDRLWSKWQNVDADRRVYGGNALYGTSTILNGNSTPPVDLDTVINWGYLGRPKRLREVMSITAGDYCYCYDT